VEVRDKCKHLQYKGLQISAYAIGFFIGDPDAGSRKADVNMLVLSYKMSMVSRSTRSAWIETGSPGRGSGIGAVALHTERVD